jgi:hypothetical protein
VNDTSADDVVYHGYHHGSAGAGVVAIETDQGEQLGLLRHMIWHSPTGLSWGYQGSGPADLARSLLIAALGDHARCPVCAGTTKVVYNSDPELVHRCTACADGYRALPYQEFTREHVATWGNQWRMRRADIQAWLAARTDTS